MGTRVRYRPGTFCWADLSTPDQDGATAFYRALFGWEAEDVDMGDGRAYRMVSVDGRLVGAIAPQPPGLAAQGVPPTWNSYISVADAGAAAARAAELGGTVAMPATDVFDAGRMAAVQDPQGAFAFLWQPRAHHGAALVNAHGALAWNELATTDVPGAAAFYGELLGWSTEPVERVGPPYHMISGAEGLNGGIRDVEPGLPPHWLVYFGVRDIAAAVKQATELGARVFLEPLDVGRGVITVLQDPQGAVFALFQGEMDE